MSANVQQPGLLPTQTLGSATPPRGALREMLRANVLADFAFYRRSRLLMAFGLAFLLIVGLSCLPQLFSDSGVDRFNTLKLVLSQLNFFLLVLSGALGLFIVSSHLHNRSLKMVFTKPCSPAV
jgi:ABC-type transport system involved in multi-copper enzyme maturation permease subunit